MSDDAFFRELTRELEERGRLALASVVETKGSGPSRVGRRFLIFEDGTFTGTIGGGPFEALVIADSAALFREDRASHPRGRATPPRILKWYDFFEREIESSVAREPTNMICGGSARVAIELLKAAPSLVILGGGHVGRALALLGRELGYDITVADDREEYVRPERYPSEVKTVRTNRDYELPSGSLSRGRDRYVAVVSRCWETDLAALRPWVAPDAPAVRYLGLIGSARKVRGVLARLAEEGVSEERIRTIRAPIGLSIGAVTPEEIAVSILAEVTAVRRGVENPGYPWNVPADHGTANRASNS
jgi:xanthine dehydrogenase accessory factor